MNDCLTHLEKLGIKKRLIEKCLAIIQQRITATAAAMTNAQEAANAEEKSSAGDKYETARAMNQLEREMHARQLKANQTELAALLKINYSIHPSIDPGSFIQCDKYAFFIAAGLGKIIFEDKEIYLLSPNAPLAKLLCKNKKGDIINFKNLQQTILDVF